MTEKEFKVFKQYQHLYNFGLIVTFDNKTYNVSTSTLIFTEDSIKINPDPLDRKILEPLEIHRKNIRRLRYRVKPGPKEDTRDLDYLYTYYLENGFINEANTIKEKIKNRQKCI